MVGVITKEEMDRMGKAELADALNNLVPSKWSARGFKLPSGLTEDQIQELARTLGDVLKDIGVSNLKETAGSTVMPVYSANCAPTGELVIYYEAE